MSEPTLRPDRLVAAGEANYASGQRDGSTLPLRKVFAFFRRDVPVPGWLFLGAVALIALDGLLGVNLIVTWFS